MIKMLYKIGEFSKLVGVPVKTLRYYDSIDLFKPSEVDMFTSYRYYKEEQKEDFDLILALKEVGFSLEEIREHWNQLDESFFLKRKQELLQDMERTGEMIKKVDHLRSQLQDGKIGTEQKEKEKIRKKSIL